MRQLLAVVSIVVLSTPTGIGVADGQQAAPKAKPARAAAEATPEAKKDWMSKAVDDLLTGPQEIMRMTPNNAPGYSPTK